MPARPHERLEDVRHPDEARESTVAMLAEVGDQSSGRGGGLCPSCQIEVEGEYVGRLP